MKLTELYAKKQDILAKCERLQKDENATAGDITAATEELRKINAKIEFSETQEDNAKKEAKKKIENGTMSSYDSQDDAQRSDEEYEAAFFNVLRGRALTADQQIAVQEVNNALSSETGEDGGYLIPVDQQTAIKELKRSMQNLEGEVNVENVTTKSGSRVIEKDAEHTAFTEFTEADDLTETDSPQFQTVEYSIKDRGGILPVKNNLLNDNTANLKSYLNKWLAKKSVATRNKLIADLLATLTPTAVADLDDIKDILNVQLDPSIKEMAKVYTNQDGFNKLDKMKDSDGNYLLQPDPTDKTKKLLAGKEVKVYSNKVLKTTGTTTLLAPIYIGALKECITLFDRQAISLLSTLTGGTAFGKNRTEIRAITREDVQLVDSKSMVFGQLDVTP